MRPSFPASLRRGGVVAALLCAVALDAHAGDASVDITRSAFVPPEITVAPGTTITWSNRDEIPHTVNAYDRSFASKAMDTADRYTHTFDSEGDFAYFCAVHPFMTGIVHVRRP